ncbi:MAG: hypothetical protein V1751_04525 [Pseudomonadota bacterium]
MKKQGQRPLLGEHVNGSSDGIVSQRCYLLREIGDWNRYLQEEEEGNLVNEIRKCSLAGRPCGDEAFIETLESRFSRRLKPLPQGRPRKGNNGRCSCFSIFS